MCLTASVSMIMIVMFAFAMFRVLVFIMIVVILMIMFVFCFSDMFFISLLRAICLVVRGRCGFGGGFFYRRGGRFDFGRLLHNWRPFCFKRAGGLFGGLARHQGKAARGEQED